MAHLGSRVTIKDLDFDDQFDIQLVGSFEADPANDLISITSPLGSALLMREEGEEVEVDAPAGKQRYRIEKIL
jgi:transcription elongation factor GreA